jgi:hypothetical protein
MVARVCQVPAGLTDFMNLDHQGKRIVPKQIHLAAPFSRKSALDHYYYNMATNWK